MIFLDPGTLLIASPEMLDPNFMHTVAMVGHHDGEGAQGLVINRCKPGGMSLAGLEIQEGGPWGLASTSCCMPVMSSLIAQPSWWTASGWLRNQGLFWRPWSRGA